VSGSDRNKLPARGLNKVFLSCCIREEGSIGSCEWLRQTSIEGRYVIEAS